MKNFEIKQLGRTADIYIYGDITSMPLLPGEQSAMTVVDQINAVDADIINVHIDSFGGDVAEGWGMYNALKAQKAEVATFADGFVASAALYPFLAGKQRYCSSVSAFFLHEVSSGAFGYADELRKQADAIDKMTEMGIQAFVESAGMDAETVKQLMEAETWLTPAEAIQHGIATAMTDKAPEGIVQSARQAAMKQLFAVTPKQEPAEDKSETIFNLH